MAWFGRDRGGVRELTPNGLKYNQTPTTFNVYLLILYCTPPTPQVGKHTKKQNLSLDLEGKTKGKVGKLYDHTKHRPKGKVTGGQTVGPHNTRDDLSLVVGKTQDKVGKLYDHTKPTPKSKGTGGQTVGPHERRADLSLDLEKTKDKVDKLYDHIEDPQKPQEKVGKLSDHTMEGSHCHWT